MIMLSSSFKRFIIFGIIFISIILGIRQSNIGKTGIEPREVELRRAERVFNDSYHSRKTVVNFAVNNFPAAAKLFNEVIASEGVLNLYHESSNVSIVSVIEIPEENFNYVLSRFRDLPGLQTEKTETIDDIALSAIDVTSRIEQNRYLLQRYRERLNNPYLTTREIGEIQGQIRSIQTVIDSLYQLDHIRTQQLQQKHLVLAVISRIDPPHTTGSLMKYIYFALWTVISFIVITIIVVLLYLGMILLDKLFVTLGIRSLNKDSHYHYRYHSYINRNQGSSRDGRIKRKRKYKPLEEGEKTESTPPNEDNR
ncbi:MAG: DUF4349 domain-containing protein [Candidatus Cloacimonetes bacterium]|nr:DUF4349 domain-containing protein [Candidatus Cloacimonadota bacterium]